MYSKTLFLYLAFILVSFNLWNEWKQAHQPVSFVSESQHSSVKLEQAASSYKSSEIKASTIHVQTDVLNLKINTQNGDIVFVSLPKYLSSSASDASPLILMQQNLMEQYYASSHFVTMVNHQPETLNLYYRSAQPDYSLRANQDHLNIVLTAQTDQGVQIQKIYTLHRGSYVIDLHYQINNLSPSTWKAYLNQQLIWQNPKIPSFSIFQMGQYRSYTGGSFSQPGKHRYKKVSFDDMKKQNLDIDTHGGWVAMQEHYFLSAWIPNQSVSYRLYTQANQDKYVIGVVSEAYELPAKQRLNLSSQLYVGPEQASVLKSLAPGLDQTVDYGILWFLSSALFSLMKTIEKIVGNWGWSIVIITVLIKLMFYRLSAQSYKSMANMRRLQPKMEQLKQRFGHDKAKFSQATMELYRQEKVNPLGGCLPMLVQLPVFIALYSVLVETIDLRQAPFIGWIHDLSVADPYHVLPLLMGLSLFVQQKMNPTPPDPTQAKAMMLLPVFMTVIFWGFPSGLVLYWIVNTSLSIFQQWWIIRKFNHLPMIASS